MIDTALVIPCYNEAHRLDSECFLAFVKACSGILLIFVDDGSTDGTIAVLESLRTGDEESIQILKLTRNQGKAEAVRQGVLHALEGFRPAVIGYWDADLATPLTAVAQLREVFARRPEIEMVFGARVQLLGRYVKRKAVRHYLGRAFATVVSLVLDLEIYDSQCGAKLFRVQPETRAVFAEPFLSKWVFDVEILARYKHLFSREDRALAGAVYEYPLERWVDVAGSKVRASDFFVALRDVYRIRKRYLC